MATIRKIAYEFPELNGVKYVTIYSADKPFVGVDLFDLVGVDDYRSKSAIFSENGGAYTMLRNQIEPWQKTVIVPGCGGFDPYKTELVQDPIPFVYYAETHPEISMIIAFTWFDTSHPGCGSNGWANAYLNAGDYVLGTRSTLP